MLLFLQTYGTIGTIFGILCFIGGLQRRAHPIDCLLAAFFTIATWPLLLWTLAHPQRDER